MTIGVLISALVLLAIASSILSYIRYKLEMRAAHYQRLIDITTGKYNTLTASYEPPAQP